VTAWNWDKIGLRSEKHWGNGLSGFCADIGGWSATRHMGGVTRHGRCWCGKKYQVMRGFAERMFGRGNVGGVYDRIGSGEG